MQKWEYCVITNMYDDMKHQTSTCFSNLTANGREITHRYRSSFDAKVACLIAQLGEEGWEMVGAGTTTYEHTFYFKRPE